MKLSWFFSVYLGCLECPRLLPGFLLPNYDFENFRHPRDHHRSRFDKFTHHSIRFKQMLLDSRLSYILVA